MLQLFFCIVIGLCVAGITGGFLCCLTHLCGST